MNATQKVLVTLLSSAIRGKGVDVLDTKDIDWEEVFKEAEAHSVLPLIYPLVKEIGKVCQIDSKMMSKCSNISIINGIYQMQHINQMNSVFKAFEEAKIPIIALKGLVLRELYPKPEFRIMSDSDILIHKYDYKTAEKILESLGYSKYGSFGYESCFIHDSALSIDLHFSLVDKDHLRNVAPFENTIWQNLRSYNFNGIKISALSLEYELIYLFIHIGSHIVKSGFGLRQLCDIVLFIENSQDEIDWNCVYNLADACKLNKLISTVLYVCHNLFCLSIPEIYRTTYSKSNEYIVFLTNEVFENGVYGKKNTARIISNNMLRYNLQAHRNSNSVKLVLKYLFPSIDKLPLRYAYASKYPVLIVFAWVHRLGYELFFNCSTRLKELIKLKSTTALVKSRYELIEWLQLK